MLRNFLLSTVFTLSVSMSAISAHAQDATSSSPAAAAASAKPESDATPSKPESAATNANVKAQDAQQQQPNAAAQASATGGDAGASAAPASTEPETLKENVWKFNGMLGALDKQSAQRGFQVYKQVCSACHSMNLVAYRSLKQLGFSEAEVKAVAAEKQVDDFDDKGQPKQRPALPSDHFVPPFANEDASRAANNGAYPPDLSLIVKARNHGPDYVYSLLTGFGKAPSTETPVANKYYNPYFAGHWISMPPPLMDNAVTYQDGTPATVDQMARDVVTFLEWTAEPEMQQRHEMGMRVMFFLVFLTAFFYVAKKRVWKNLDDKK